MLASERPLVTEHFFESELCKATVSTEVATGSSKIAHRAYGEHVTPHPDDKPFERPFLFDDEDFTDELIGLAFDLRMSNKRCGVLIAGETWRELASSFEGARREDGVMQAMRSAC